jgi:leucyl-tRNA synthetase
MSTGPLDQSRPWETRDVVGVFRLLQRVWRNLVDEETGALSVGDGPADDETLRVMARSVEAVRESMESMRFNVAVAKITELNNHLTAQVPRGQVPRDVAETLVLLLAPLAPHIGEELWSKLGHDESLVREPFPVADPAYLVDETVEIPVQINGKVRARIEAAVGLDEAGLEAAVRADPKAAAVLDGKTIRKVVVVPDRLVNFVVEG